MPMEMKPTFSSLFHIRSRFMSCAICCEELVASAKGSMRPARVRSCAFFGLSRLMMPGNSATMSSTIFSTFAPKAGSSIDVPSGGVISSSASDLWSRPRDWSAMTEPVTDSEFGANQPLWER